MAEAYIVEAIRTAGGRRGGRLAGWHPADLAGFTGAPMIADKHGFSRGDLDRFALQSQQRASAAAGAGAFDRDILPVAVEGAMHETDDGIRHDATLEAIAAVKPLQEGGTISAANASQICDGASGVLVVSGRALQQHGLTPIARIHALAVSGADPSKLNVNGGGIANVTIVEAL